MIKCFTSLRPIIEGNDKTFAGQVLRGILAPVGLLTAGVAGCRRRAYQRGWLKAQSFSVPVISIGNITAGGTGKTPMVLFLTGYLLAKGYKPGIVSRGYGARNGQNDENKMLRQNFPELILRSDPDRNLAITQALDAGADCILMDDGFQRLSTRRDLDILLLDATSPFGGGRCLPAGLLREPLSALKNADIIVLTRMDQAENDSLGEIEEILAEAAPEIPVVLGVHQPDGLKTLSGEELPLGHLKELSVAALSSIARPDCFIKTLAGLCREVKASFPYPDHYVYDESDLRRTLAKAEAAQAEAIITTEKDMVKIVDLLAGNRLRVPIYVLSVKMEISRGRELLMNAIDRILPGRS